MHSGTYNLAHRRTYIIPDKFEASLNYKMSVHLERGGMKNLSQTAKDDGILPRSLSKPTLFL